MSEKSKNKQKEKHKERMTNNNFWIKEGIWLKAFFFLFASESLEMRIRKLWTFFFWNTRRNCKLFIEEIQNCETFWWKRKDSSYPDFPLLGLQFAVFLCFMFIVIKRKFGVTNFTFEIKRKFEIVPNVKLYDIHCHKRHLSGKHL